MIRAASEITARCESLAAGGWHPQDICLSWWSDTGWQLEIEINDWVGFGTPADELPGCLDLPVPYSVASPTAGLTSDPPQGITVLGGQKAPTYVEPLHASEAWHEQAEAIIAEFWQQNDGGLAGPEKGYSDLRHTPYKARHRWHRCRVWQWQSDESKQLKDRAEAMQIDRKFDALPSPEQPLKINGGRMSVLRPCGCITHHHQAPGKGGKSAPSKLRFGRWLTTVPCVPCLNQKLVS